MQISKGTPKTVVTTGILRGGRTLRGSPNQVLDRKFMNRKQRAY